MKRFASILLTLALLGGCAPEPSAPPPAQPARPAQPPVTDAAERGSLPELARGAAVVGRTGEILLGFDALRTIDGDPGSFWMNPHGDLPQSMTVALPARSRIDRVGIRTAPRGTFTANHVTFEASADGKTFAPLITAKAADTGEAQWFDTKPVDASHIRITIDDALLPGHDVRLISVLARGTELEPPHPGDIGGCWSFNGEPAQFERQGGHVRGILMTGKEPIRFDGGFDGRVTRLNWIRGNDYGMTLIAVSPDGRHLSGINWHEEAIPMFFDTSWYGERRPCSASLPSFDVAGAFVRRTGRFSLYDASELPRLLHDFPGGSLVAHEFRLGTSEENRAAAQKALDDLRRKVPLPGGIKFVVQGSDDPRQLPVTDAMRVLYSTVDYEIRR